MGNKELLNYEPSQRNEKGQWAKGARKKTVKEGHKKCTECLIVKPFSEFHYMKPKTPQSDPVKPKCKECRKIESAKDYEKRGDFIRKQQSEARNKMTDEQRRQERKRIRKWEAENPERVKKNAQRYRSTDEYKDKAVENYQKRRALQVQALSEDFTLGELRSYWIEQGINPDLCTYCDDLIAAKRSIGDHVIPLSKGGSHAKENLVPCCQPCNSSKHNKTLYEEWTPPNQRSQQNCNKTPVESGQ